MKKITYLAAVAMTSMVTMACWTFAQAAVSLPSGFYIEGTAGTSHSMNKTYGPGTTFNNSGFAWSGDAGYKFMQYFAVEVGGTSYANSDVKNSAGSQFEKDRHYAYDMAMKGIVPIADTGLEVFGKLGVARLYSSVAITDRTAAAATGIYSGTKNNSTTLYMGAGADYYFMPTWGGSLQWARAKGNSQTGVQDLYSVGIIWNLY